MFAILLFHLVDYIFEPGIGIGKVIQDTRAPFLNSSRQELSHKRFTLGVGNVKIRVAGHRFTENLGSDGLWAGILVAHAAQLLNRLRKIRLSGNIDQRIRLVEIVLLPPLMMRLFALCIGS